MITDQRLSKLQKTILGVLEALDNNDWDSFYKKHQPKNKSPYWHKVKRTYYDDGSGFKSRFEKGVKDIVVLAYLKQMGFKSFTDTIGKTTYFDTPQSEQVKTRLGYPMGFGASAFSVSFSRSLRSLLKKDLIMVKRWKKEIKEVRLNANK